MTKFFGAVGYGTTEETAASVYVDVIVEKQYYGDVLRKTRSMQESETVNADLTISSQISIVADEYAFENMFAIRYVSWMGAFWTVITVDPQRPRLLLTLGGVYNGKKAGA